MFLRQALAEVRAHEPVPLSFHDCSAGELSHWLLCERIPASWDSSAVTDYPVSAAAREFEAAQAYVLSLAAH